MVDISSQERRGSSGRTELKATPSTHPLNELWRWRWRLVLLAQLIATSMALGWLPNNWAKLAVMVTLWVLTFRHITHAEFLMMAGVNLLFAVMNAAALARGIFRFDHPDFFGMPIYEYLMWGFYTLHTIRFLGGEPPRGQRIAAVAAAVAFALPFATIADPAYLLLTSTAVLAACFVLFHQRMDLAYAAYMAVLGALIECVGVSTGQWHYPGQPDGNIPLWFLTMWAGVGLLTRQLLLPLIWKCGRGHLGISEAKL
jgi:hypothetical protein